MSTDWTFHCMDCNEKPGEFEVGCGTQVLKSIYKVRQHVLAIREQEKTHYLEVSMLGNYAVYDLWPFFEAHSSHRMQLMSEYGAVEPLEDVAPEKDGHVGEAGALFAFLGWLTSREPRELHLPFEVVAYHNPAEAGQLADRFCKMQDWKITDELWHKHIKSYVDPETAGQAETDALPQDGKVGEAGAVFAFMAWLTTRQHVAGPFSAFHKSDEGCQLVSKFCDMQGWGRPPDHYEKRLKSYSEMIRWIEDGKEITPI